MASKTFQSDDPLQKTFHDLWKLKDSVKVRISSENMKHGAEIEIPEIKVQ